MDIVEYARTLIGTKYGHKGRDPSYVLDCVGVLTSPAQHFNITFHDIPEYSRWSSAHTLIDELDKCLLRQPEDAEMVPGMALAFQIGKSHMHACIVAPYPTVSGQLAMIHSLISFRKVTEHILDDKWRDRIIAMYKYPGVDY